MIAGRRPTGFGATTEYHTVNRLVVPEAAMRVEGKKFFHSILANGQWAVKKLDFRLGDRVTIRTRVTGVGMGYLYLSYQDDDKPTLLAIKKVTPGFHDLNFKVPYAVLPNFRVGISTTVPKGYTIDRLPKEDRHKLHTNSMMISQSAPMYETPGIGFGGFGAALQDLNQTPQGGRDSASNPHWDGNWENYHWSNGHAGDAATITNVNNESVPEARGSYHGYYAHRSNLMFARFDVDDKFLGWDAIESKSYTVPAGIPICIVMQFFALPKKTKSGGNISGPDDGEMLNPYWRYAPGMRINPAKFHLIQSEWQLHNKWKKPSAYSSRWNKSTGPIKNAGRYPVTDKQYPGSGFELDGRLVNPDEIAAKVEWFTNGVWSEPRTTPPSIPETNQDGYTKVIYRTPRQLSPTADKDVLEELDALGVDYRYETTKKYFPTPHVLENGRVTKGYTLYARPLDGNNTLAIEENGEIYVAERKLKLHCVFQYSLHRRAGRIGDLNGSPQPGWTYLQAPMTKFADPEKMSRMNNPELYTAFYPVGGFKTGGIVVAIGKSLGIAAGQSSAITSAQNTNPMTVWPDRNWTTPDGSRIGTTAACWLRPKGIILATDLEDDRMAATEEQVQAVWKAKFGEPLTASFFAQYGIKDQIKEKPTHYRVKDVDTGMFVEAPYQIIYFEIGPEYTGPYADYELVTTEEETQDGLKEKVVTLKLTKPEGKPYALGKNDPMFLNVRTFYGKQVSQKIDIIDEVEEQRSMMEVGLTPEEQLAYNELNNKPVETTAAIAEIEKEEQRLTDITIQDGLTGETSDSTEPGTPRLPRGAKYVRSGDSWKLYPKYYTRESTLKEAGFLGGIKSALGGFTDSRDFYVEDVTQKWGASGSSGLNGLGFVDSAEEDLDDVLRDTGYLMQAMTNSAGAGAGAVYNVMNGDMDKAGDKFDYIIDSLTDANPDNHSVITISANIARNASQAAGKGAVEGAADLINDVADSLGGYSSNGLGDFADKAAGVGEGVGKFVRGTARGLAPEALTEGVDDGIGALTDKFKERPLLYTGLALAAAPLLIPGIGGAYARNVTTLAGGAIGLVPKGFKALTGGVSAIASGVIDGGKQVGNSIATSPSKRGTAASRRRSRRR
jgi:hypothetical protein